MASAGGPVRDAAVEHGARVDALRGQDRGCDAGPRSRLADRHHRSIRGHVRTAGREQAVGDVAASGDVAGIPLVALAHVDQLGSTGEELPELVEAHGLHLFGAPIEHIAVDIEKADGPEASDRALGLLGARSLDDHRLLRVEHERRLRRERAA